MHTISKREWRHLQSKLISGVSDTEGSYCCSINTISSKIVIQAVISVFVFHQWIFFPLWLLLAKWTTIWTLTWHCRTVNFVFPLSTLRDGLMGQTALACQLRLLTSDPGSNPRLLLQMLLYRDCHLPQILLENSRKSCLSGVDGLVCVTEWKADCVCVCMHAVYSTYLAVHLLE